MKICFLADGNSIHTQRWCSHFLSLGHEVHLITFRQVKQEGIHTHYINIGPIDVSGKNWKVLFSGRKIRKIVGKIQPDILHAHYATSYGIAGALSRFHPFAVTALGSDVLVSPKNSNLYRKLLRYVFKRADWITVMADHMRDAATEMKLGGENKLTVLPFGIDTVLFNSGNRTLPADRFVITSTRNFEEVYNIPHLVKAVAAIKDKIPGLKLNLVGDGRKRSEIESLVDEMGLRPCTVFYGKIPQEEIAAILKNSHAFVSVSLSDGNNISLNEAMACGAFCIATNIPANTQWIRNHENGFLVEVNSTEQLAGCILNVFENYRELSEKAIPLNNIIISEKADWIKNMATVEKKYQELCSPK